MAITYTAAVKNSRMTAVKTAAGSNAKLVIGTAGMASTLVTFDLGASSGTVTTDYWDVITSGSPVSTTASAAGTAASAKITTSGGTDIATGLTVGTSGTDIILDNTNIALAQTIIINSARITHAA